MPALFIVCVIDILGFGILIPLVPYMADRFGASPELITPILGAYSLCQLLAAPFWGRLSDRYGRRPILMSSLAGACVSYAMLGVADNLWWLLASRVLAGFMAGNIAAAFAYASDISSPENRAKSMGTVGAAIGVGFMFGPAIGGLLAGNDEHTANFALPAIVSACLSLLAISLVFFLLPESHSKEHRTTHHEPHAGHPIRLLRERPTLRLIVSGAFLVTCSQAILESIFAIWAMNRFGFGPRTVGVVLFCLALIPVAMQGWAGAPSGAATGRGPTRCLRHPGVCPGLRDRRLFQPSAARDRRPRVLRCRVGALQSECIGPWLRSRPARAIAEP